MKKIFSIILLTLSLSQLFPAKYAGEFLLINSDVRSLGMGNCGVSFSESAASFKLNPANIMNNIKMNISTMYSSLYGNPLEPLANYNYLGFSIPFTTEGAAVALNWVRLSIDDISYFPKYGDAERFHEIEANNGEPGDVNHDDYFTDREDAVFLTVAKRIDYDVSLGWDYFSFPLKINLGMNVKFINITVFENEASGIGFDAGTSIMIGLKKFLNYREAEDLRVGFVISDFNKTGISWSSTAQDAIPIRYKFGMSYPVVIKSISSTFTLAYDILSDYDDNNINNYGFEYGFKDMLKLRVGLADSDKFTAGTAIFYKGFTLDYAFMNEELGAVNKIGLGYSF